MGKSVEPNTAASRAEDGAGLGRVVKVQFEDCGQDFLFWTIDARGKVLESAGQNWLWEGTSVVSTPIVGECLDIVTKHGDQLTLKYKVVAIEVTESEKSPAKTVVLGPDHEGMRIDASGVLCNNNKGSTQFRKMMLGHLQELAQRYYAGDTGAVDDFLQVYCLGVDARKLAKERQNSAAAAEGGR